MLVTPPDLMMSSKGLTCLWTNNNPLSQFCGSKWKDIDPMRRHHSWWTYRVNIRRSTRTSLNVKFVWEMFDSEGSMYSCAFPLGFAPFLRAVLPLGLLI